MSTVPYFPRPLATVAPRDLLLAERLGLKRTDVVLEIGTGSGSSLFRLAPAVAAYHGVDIARQPVERLRREVQRQGLENVDFFVRDFCRPGAAETL
ncbi:MAG TPA: class I SAM-dependent methyltransferase, partial [Pirellulales bacterium]|nr:class I SAM-dependent methyltransferase [Pirellulales bacterium]